MYMFVLNIQYPGVLVVLSRRAREKYTCSTLSEQSSLDFTCITFSSTQNSYTEKMLYPLSR